MYSMEQIAASTQRSRCAENMKTESLLSTTEQLTDAERHWSSSPVCLSSDNIDSWMASWAMRRASAKQCSTSNCSTSRLHKHTWQMIRQSRHPAVWLYWELLLTLIHTAGCSCVTVMQHASYVYFTAVTGVDCRQWKTDGQTNRRCFLLVNNLLPIMI